MGADPDRAGGTEGSGWAVVESEWGQIGLVEREGAVVFLALADDRAVVEGAIDREYPNATSGARARKLGNEVARRIGADEGFDGIPAEVSGTGFEEAVWRELIRIPRGEVVTYGELARRIGRPGAARSVGSACGSNPVALLVPCHRVIAADGRLGGYRWGAERKAGILASEGVDLPRGRARSDRC